MKIVLIILLVALFGFIGFGIANYYIMRKKFFFSFSSFLTNLKSNVGFNAKKITEVISDNSIKNNKDLNKLLDNYNSILISEDRLNKEVLFSSINILNEQEKESIFAFFNNLGKVDIFNQMEQIGYFSQSISEFYISAKEESRKNCNLYTKLGILFGLFLALMLI